MQYDTLIIDGPYLAHRSYAAPYKLTTTTGMDSTLIHSFIRSLYSFYKKFKPQLTIVAWESHGTKSWRRQQYPAYKPHDSIDMTYVKEVTDLKDILYLLDVPQFSSATNEADDVIATLTKRMSGKNNIVYTKDKDIMQVITNTTHMFDGKKVLRPQHVIEKFGVLPKQIPDFLAIVGDKSDNIVGIKGYGGKKTSDILMTHHEVECLPYTLFDESTLNKIKNNKRLTLLNNICELTKIPENEPSLTLTEMLDRYELINIKRDINKYRRLGESWEM